MKYPSSLEKKNPWICPFDDYFALNILCMFNAIKVLYCIVHLWWWLRKVDWLSRNSKYMYIVQQIKSSQVKSNLFIQSI